MSRPNTSSSRVDTSSRPRTSASVRPGTSGGSHLRPGTAQSTASTLGPAPRVFQPDNAGYDEQEEGLEDDDEEGSEEDDEEEDVFAYRRPQTGKTPASGRLSAFGQSESGRSAPPSVSTTFGSTAGTRLDETASSSRGAAPSSVPLEQHGDSSLSSSSTVVVPPSPHQGLHSAAQSTFVPSRSGEASFQDSQVSLATSDGVHDAEDGRDGEVIRMTSFSPLVMSPYRSDDGQPRSVQLGGSSRGGIWNEGHDSRDRRESAVQAMEYDQRENAPMDGGGSFDDFEKSI